MNFIIIGLGNFGAALGARLTEQGHEVMGVDIRMERVELLKDTMTHAMQLDARDLHALKSLPLKNSMRIVVGIGEDFGASVEVTANLKQLGYDNILARAISQVHETILQAIGVEDILHPEKETAERLAQRLDIKGVLDSFRVSKDHKIIEAVLPGFLEGKTIVEAKLRENYRVNVVTILKRHKDHNSLGASIIESEVIGVWDPSRPFEADDILVLFGATKDIDRLLER